MSDPIDLILQELQQADPESTKGINIPPLPPYITIGDGGILLVSRPCRTTEEWVSKWSDDPTVPAPPPAKPDPPPEPRVVKIGRGLYLRKPPKDPSREEREFPTP